MLTPFRFFLFPSLLVATIFGTLLPGCVKNQRICNGGGRQVGNACFCARGQTWDGSRCQGTPQTGVCTQKGAMEVVGVGTSMCFCPNGWIWTDANRTECVACRGGSLAKADASGCVCPDGTSWIDEGCHRTLVCTGGARQVGGDCYCPRGQTWDGARCQGTPQTGICTQRNAMEVTGEGHSKCYCPDGWIWTDANRTECVMCKGGSLAKLDASGCVCPAGTAWVDNACQQIPPPQVAVAQPTCAGGAIATDQGCVCPQGTGWNGNTCVVVQTTQRIEIRQRSVQSSSSFTCCVNHARFTCPNQATFQACMTLSPNHGCTRTGGC